LAAASDTLSFPGVQFHLDRHPLPTRRSSDLYTLAWNTVTVPNGPHTLTAVARDAAGNTGTSGAVAITVNNDVTPPVLSGVSASSDRKSTRLNSSHDQISYAAFCEKNITTNYG